MIRSFFIAALALLVLLVVISQAQDRDDKMAERERAAQCNRRC